MHGITVIDDTTSVFCARSTLRTHRSKTHLFTFTHL